jgi:hypothetical protein
MSQSKTQETDPQADAVATEDEATTKAKVVSDEPELSDAELDGVAGGAAKKM